MEGRQRDVLDDDVDAEEEKPIDKSPGNFRQMLVFARSFPQPWRYNLSNLDEVVWKDYDGMKLRVHVLV